MRLGSSAFCIYFLARRAYSSVLSKPDPLPKLSAFPLQRGMPPIQPLAMRAPPPPSVLIKGLGLPPHLPSAVRAYGPLLRQWEVICAYREDALFCDTRRI